MKDLYTVVAVCARNFIKSTYYSDLVCSFEISYDGKNWETCREIITLDENCDINFLNDWNEGQQFIKNIRFIHIEEIDQYTSIIYCEVDKNE